MDSTINSNRSKSDWGNLSLFRLGAFGFGMTGFFLAMDTIILPTLVLEVAPEGAKNTLLGALGFGGLLVAALVQPIIGWYSDRTRTPLGRRVPFMLWSTALVCLGLAGLALDPNPGPLSLLIIWIFMQANASIGYGPFQAVIRDLVPVHRIGIASSIKILSDAGGGVVLVAVSGFLIGQYTGAESVQWLWLTLGVIGITLILSNLISSTTLVTRERAAGLTRHSSQGHQWIAPSLHPQLSWFLVSRFLFVTSIFIFPTYGLFFLRDVVEVENPAQTLGTMILAIGGSLALSVYPAGWVSDKVGRKPVVMAGAVGAAIGTIAILWASNVTEVLIIASAIGASVGVLLSSNWALANELGTAGREGQHMGIVTLASVVGAATSKALGPGVDLLNLAASGSGYTALIVGSATAFVLGALLLLPLKAAAPLSPSTEDTPHQATS